MHSLGVSINLFFVTQFLLFLCLTIMFLTYGIYSLIVNRKVSLTYKEYLIDQNSLPTTDALIVY